MVASIAAEILVQWREVSLVVVMPDTPAQMAAPVPHVLLAHTSQVLVRPRAPTAQLASIQLQSGLFQAPYAPPVWLVSIQIRLVLIQTPYAPTAQLASIQL